MEGAICGNAGPESGPRTECGGEDRGFQRIFSGQARKRRMTGHETVRSWLIRNLHLQLMCRSRSGDARRCCRRDGRVKPDSIKPVVQKSSGQKRTKKRRESSCFFNPPAKPGRKKGIRRSRPIAPLLFGKQIIQRGKGAVLFDLMDADLSVRNGQFDETVPAVVLVYADFSDIFSVTIRADQQCSHLAEKKEC